MALSPEAALPAAVPTWPDGAHWSDRSYGSDGSGRGDWPGWRHRSNGSYRGHRSHRSHRSGRRTDRPDWGNWANCPVNICTTRKMP